MLDLVIRHARLPGRDELVDLGFTRGRLTDCPERLMNLADDGVAVGNPADVVVLDATSPPAQAVAEIRQPLAAFKNGRRMLTRSRPELHHPGAG